MTTFRYSSTGNWYKGNTHIHSTASDGGLNFIQLADLYASAGYDFLFRTDHWVCSDCAADPHPYPLLWLDGIELDGDDYSGANYHVVILGTVKGIDRSLGVIESIRVARRYNGLVILAHPQWTGNSFNDALRWSFDGVEVYNHICQWLNGKGYAGPYWNAMLERHPNTLGFASDDAHIHPADPGWNGAWVMVNAPTCDRPAILNALRTGQFYSSNGPVFHAIQYDGQRISFESSAVQFARLVGPRWWGKPMGSFDGTRLTGAAFPLPAQLPEYLYLEIEDEQGRKAWTNPLFV